jgi:dTDP-6-deoxy-L-talose 4-dehydrogenase (NAD+)
VYYLAIPRDVFITGATGYIGRRLTDALVARGHRVRALVRDRQASAQSPRLD